MINFLTHPVTQGGAGVTLLQVIPATAGGVNIQTIAQITIVAITTIFQIIGMFKKRKSLNEKAS